MKNISARNQIINFGLITSFFGVSFSLMQFFLGTHYENDPISLVISFIILFSGIAACILNFKKKSNNDFGIRYAMPNSFIKFFNF